MLTVINKNQNKIYNINNKINKILIKIMNIHIIQNLLVKIVNFKKELIEVVLCQKLLKMANNYNKII